MTLFLLLLDQLWTQWSDCPWYCALAILVLLPCAALHDWRRISSPKVPRRTSLVLKTAGFALLGYLWLGLIPLPQASLPKPVVSIDKASRRLKFRTMTMKIALSRSAQGTKLQEGDGKTPEGLRRICSKAPEGPFGRWLGLDYPNREEAWQGRWVGRLSWLELTRWRWFWRNEPPQSTRLGGQVGIHGGGNHPNWTLGCIALDNSDMEVLYQALSVGDVVEIH